MVDILAEKMQHCPYSRGFHLIYLNLIYVQLFNTCRHIGCGCRAAKIPRDFLSTCKNGLTFEYGLTMPTIITVTDSQCLTIPAQRVPLQNKEYLNP